MSTLSPAFAEFLPTWVSAQRWYTGKGRTPDLHHLGTVRWEVPQDGVLVETHIVLDTSGTTPVAYQVPLTCREAPVDSIHTALVTTLKDSESGTRYIYDGTADPAYVQALLSTMMTSAEVASSDSEDATRARGTSLADHLQDATVRRSVVLSGEQSNTSIIAEVADHPPVIVKVFRVIQDGSNPDVEIQQALAHSGTTAIAQPVGYLTGEWAGVDGARAAGHLAFAQEFLPGVEDAWRVATRAARHGLDLSSAAYAIGVATAAIHLSLREAFPVAPADQPERDGMTAALMRRLDHAIEAVPDLAEFRTAAEDLYHDAAAVQWPDLQRVHGDLHLGQVLHVAARDTDEPQTGERWVLVDFEGEPLRPLAERVAPDLAWRDVAGMLRSFDYAAAMAAHQEDEVDDDGGTTINSRAWALRCRQAFLDGYRAESGVEVSTDDQKLLDALELDKALYEVVYESRNRPGWVQIPTRAIRRILTDSGAGAAVTGTATDVVAVDEEPATSSLGENPAAGKQQTDQSVSDGVTDAAAEENSRPSPSDTPEHRPARRPLDGVDAERLVRGVHPNPHDVLGAHPFDGGVTIRALRPMATSVAALLPGGRRLEMDHETHGIFTGVLDDQQVTDYRIEARWDDGEPQVSDEPYRFLPTVGEIDQHLISEGRHEQLWDVLGAHLRSYDGPLGPVHGVSFAVWAPHAAAVQVVGDFNAWNPSAHPMRALGSSGIWEIFIPGASEGSKYKFAVVGRDGQTRLKADPMARAAEIPPDSASVVTHRRYQWSDQEWMDRRARHDPHLGPMSVYEVHLGSWRQGLSYVDLAHQLVDYVRSAGFTHVEFMPVMQHPYAPSWGYHVTGYYAADARFGSPDELRFLIDRLHQAGIGVILDWVPGHFATDPWALANFDGTPLYEHPDPRRGWHQEWGSYIFDFGKPQVRNFLVANALYWIEEFHADGLRVDGVASMLYLDYSREPGQWLPNKYGGRENLEAVALLQEVNATVYKRNPGAVTIAEESTSWPGVTRRTDADGLGFGFKWNMGWMHDSLEYVAHQPIHRQYHHHQLTFSLMYAFSEHFLLPISHDEVVHGKGSLVRKMAGDRWQQLANLRAYLAFMWAHPGKQLLFMGSEFAQDSEWADGRSLDWWLLEQPAHSGVLRLVRDLNTVYRGSPALWEGDHHSAGFQWLNADDAHGNTFSFLRFGDPREDSSSEGDGSEDDGSVRAGGAQPSRPTLIAVANFGGSPRLNVPLGLPYPGRWREVLNTDAELYGGSGVGNFGAVTAEPTPHHGQPYSARVTLPPLGVLWLAPEELTAEADEPDSDSDSAGAEQDTALDYGQEN